MPPPVDAPIISMRGATLLGVDDGRDHGGGDAVAFAAPAAPTKESRAPRLVTGVAAADKSRSAAARRRAAARKRGMAQEVGGRWRRETEAENVKNEAPPRWCK